MEDRIFIALGSNIGDRELNLLRAIAEIGKVESSRITAVSSFYNTEAVGEPQADFLNAVVRMQSSLLPRQLIMALQRIESGIFHRIRTARWAPRRMDLDILFFGDLTIREPDLVIPHPRLHERCFVLRPLAEIDPGLMHPVLGESVANLLQNLDGEERVTKL